MAESMVFDGSPLDKYLQESLDTARLTPDTLTPSSSFQSLSSQHSSWQANEPARNSPRDSGSPDSPWTQFLTDVSGTLKTVATNFYLPLLLGPIQSYLTLQSPPTTHNPPPDRSQRAQQTAVHDSTFAERFKLTICSSFLLTSSLSISFYETELTTNALAPTLELQKTVGHQSVHGQRPSASPLSPRSGVLPYDHVAVGPTLSDGTVVPRLDARGRSVRDVTLLASLFLYICSPTRTVWLQTVLVLACLSWSSILLLGFSSLDDQLSFELSRRPRPDSLSFLRTYPTDGQRQASESDQLQRVAVQDVSRLVRALQTFDVSVNKAVNAIQEVELVSRGFKLTQPLPPISRIEAASGSAWKHTPPRRTVLLPTADTAIGPSSYRRHNGRIHSLSLGNGRPTSLEGTAASFDAEFRKPSEQLPTVNTPPRRLLELRKVIRQSLDHASHICDSTAASLDGLIDQEEFALLKDMYALDAPAEPSEGDVSHAWTNDDLSMASVISPPLGTDRQASSTIPRSFGSNVRQADTSSRAFASPRSGHKRLSLVSDSGSVLNSSTDRQHGASSSLSNRSNVFADHASAGYRSPRLNYVSDRSGAMGGPNESAALKRLSYRSASSAASSSHHMRSPSLHSAAFGSTTAPSPPLVSSRAAKRNSLLGQQPAQATFGAGGHDEAHDSLSLLGLKSRFEAMHRSRRQVLCRLLALHLTLTGTIRLPTDKIVNPDAYWRDVCSLMHKLRRTYEVDNDTVKETVKREMGATAGESTDLQAGSTSRLVGHPGLEDRLSAMMLALRSMQAKIRVCAEDIQVTPPPGLHGFDEAAKRDTPADVDPSENMERVLSTMRDDLLGLSAEWEASLQILRKEQSIAASDVTGQPLLVPEDLISPLETDDVADPMLSTALAAESLDKLVLNDDIYAEEDNDLAALLLGSTSPDALPPPGLEQVFESIAGMAGMSGLGSKLTRDERIAQARQKREQSADGAPGARAGGLDSSGMMSELADVIHSRKAAREQLANAAPANDMGSNPTELLAEKADDSHVFALGSPLDLGAVGREGVFGGVYNGRNGARRSVSSLDMARARSRQSFEGDDSFSDGFSDDRSRSSEEFSFEATTLESVPEGAGAELAESPSVKSTPRAAQTPQNRKHNESPFDLGAQVAAYARRKAAASTHAALNGI